MNWWQHIAVAAAAAHIANIALGAQWTPQLAAAVVLGALLPDADHHKTKMFAFITVAAAATAFSLAFTSPAIGGSVEFRAAVSIVLGISTAALIFVIKPRHRGITHSPLAAAAYALIVFAITRQPIAAADALIAYGSHIAADKIT